MGAPKMVLPLRKRNESMRCDYDLHLDIMAYKPWFWSSRKESLAKTKERFAMFIVPNWRSSAQKTERERCRNLHHVRRSRKRAPWN